MVKLIWSDRAIQDIDGICRYIEQESPDYARLFGERLVAMVEGIPKHPYWGQVVPEYGREDLRERRFQSYRVVYRIAADRIDVVSITRAAAAADERLTRDVPSPCASGQMVDENARPTRDEILERFRACARELGRTPGLVRFEKLTGIKEAIIGASRRLWPKKPD